MEAKMPIRSAKSFVFRSTAIAVIRLSTLLGVQKKGVREDAL
jgi:hypothetical protein